MRRGGYVEVTRTHADGSKTVDISTGDGRLVRRIEIDRRGNEIVVIDQERVAGPEQEWQGEPVWRGRPRWYGPYADPRQVPPPAWYSDGY